MKKTKIIYWVCTVPFAGMMLFSAFPNLMSSADSIAFITDKLHYPPYIIPFLGVAKLLGVAGILIPGFAKIKEWSYAGLWFDLIGAMYSLFAIGEPIKNWAPIILFLILGIGSYVYYHKKEQEALDNKIHS